MANSKKNGRKSNGKGNAPVDFSLLTTSSVLFDAVYVPGGADSVAALLQEADAVHFVNEAYKHCKAIAASGEGVDLLRASYAASEVRAKEETTELPPPSGKGLSVITAADARKVADEFIAAIAQHRDWSREMKGDVPA